MTITEELRDRLIASAKHHIPHIDDCDAWMDGDYMSGNYNDDYGSGCLAGEAELARDLCDALGIPYEIKDP